MATKGFSRRNFIKLNSLSGFGLIAGTNLFLGSTSPQNKERGQEVSKIDSIAGMSLVALREKYRKELFDNFLPSMDQFAIDHDYGGVMCNLDIKTGKLINSNKTTWFVARGLWLYSFLYNNLKADPRYLEIAKKSKDILLKLQPNDNSFWPKDFNREGVPLSGPGDIYGSLFVAEGLFEFAKASQEKRYRNLAKSILFNCVARYDSPNYEFKIGYLPNAPHIEAPRVLGHWMLFLRICTQMLIHEPDADLEELAARSVEAIMKNHVNPTYGLTNEILNHDFSLPDNEYSQFCVIGHGLETLAFVMFEAERKKDHRLFKSARDVFKKHVDVAADYLYGGYFHSLSNVDNYTWDLRKSLWCQQEVLNGALFLIEHTNDEWAHYHFSRTHEYIYDKLYNPDHVFWYARGDRKLEQPNEILLEHYHHARELMLGILALDRMIERKAEISSSFTA